MDDASAMVLTKDWSVSPSPHGAAAAPSSTLVQDRRSSIIVERGFDDSHSPIDFSRLSSFLNQYPEGWQTIRSTLSRQEALRLAQLHRDKAMTILRVKHRWSLQAIGDVFNLSRERVRQLTPSIDGHGTTPELHDNGGPPTRAEVRTQLQEVFRKAVRTPEAWNGNGRLSKPWIVDCLGCEPRLPELDFRGFGASKVAFILRYGLDLATEEDMRAWFAEMYFERGMTYAEIAQWLSQQFVSVAPMTVHRTASTILGFEGYGRGRRRDVPSPKRLSVLILQPHLPTEQTSEVLQSTPNAVRGHSQNAS